MTDSLILSLRTFACEFPVLLFFSLLLAKVRGSHFFLSFSFGPCEDGFVPPPFFPLHRAIKRGFTLSPLLFEVRFALESIRVCLFYGGAVRRKSNPPLFSTPVTTKLECSPCLSPFLDNPCFPPGALRFLFLLNGRVHLGTPPSTCATGKRHYT